MQIKNDENPFRLFKLWMDKAKKEEINDPEAMAFSTVASTGIPSVRMVLLRDFDHRGFVFFTNYNSRKSQELNQNHNGALCFHWKSIRRQVRAVGFVEKVSSEESDNYYASRPVGSRIGAWASKQSEKLLSRQELRDRFEKYSKKFSDNEPHRPDFWGGFRLIPSSIEFWSDGKDRLHDRYLFNLSKDGGWEISRLYP